MAEATADKWDDLIQQVEALPAEPEEDKWDALIQQAEALPADEESLPSKKDEITFLDKAEDFLEDAGENIEEFAYGAEKSRWLGANVYRYAKAGGDEDLLKQREAERIAEKDKKYNLSEERKSSGFSIAGEFLGTLLDPSAFALGHVGVGAKAAQLTAAAQRAANALIVGSVSGADYAVSELSVGEEVNPIAGAASVLLGTGFGAGFVKIIKPTKDSAAKNITANYTEPLLLVQDNKVDAYIDKLNYSFNVENPSRIQALKDTQSNGKKIGAASQIQKVHRLETARRASAKKKNGYTDEQFKRITALNKEASLYLKGTGDMLARREAEVVGEGISGVAGKLKEEGTLNANMIRRAVYRPMIGAIAGVGLGYSVNWASDEEMEQDDILYYSLVGLFGGAASKALIKNNQLTSSEVNMATDEVNKIVKANSIGALNFIAAGSASAKANAMGGGVATLGKTLFSQRGANLRGAASTSVEENKDLVLQELNFNWSKVLSESNATKDGGLVNLFSGEAKKLREASYEYAEGFVDSAMLKSKGFSPTEVTTIIHLAKEATSRVGVLTEEVAATGIKMRGRVKDYKLPQFHDINKIAKNETVARQAYKRAYRIQAKADTVAKQYKADQYIDNWVDDMLSGNSSGQHISAFDGKNVFRPLTDHFEKPRMFKDFGARLEIQEFLVKDIDQVYRQYVDNTVPIMEFSRKFGAKGEGILEVKKDIERQFSKALSRANLSEKQTKELKKAKASQLKAIDGMVDDYFGFLEADSYFAKNPIAQNTAAIFTTGANVARLGKVTITSLADLVQPIQSSGVVASFKALAKQKDFAKETGFAQRDVLGDELRQYALEVKSPGRVTQRSARWVNEKFFKAIGLTKLTSYARKFAYNAGVERGFTVANKIAKGRSGTAVRNEANSLGISDEYAKTLSKFKSVEEAFEDADGNRILNMIGTKSADRDALIPQISNRRGFAKSNDPVIKGLSLFLSWAQAKATQTNSLITRMEDGHDILFVRTLGAIAVVNGIETFKSWLSDPTGSALELDQETYADQYATLENFGKATGRTGNFNHYLIDKVAQLAAGGHRSDLDDLWPALDWMTDAAKSAIPIAANVKYGDKEGAMVQVSKIAPLGREIKSGVEYVTGELYEDVPNRSSKASSRVAYEKGGEVLDVPNTSKEPDERIDKMTGMPYNQQAGTAFTDVEDREDPLQRMGFGLGSLVGRFAGKALKSVDDDIVEEVPLKTTDEIIEESKQISKALDGEDAGASAAMTADDIKNWQEINKLPESKRQKQRPEIVEKLKSVLKGDTSYDDYVSEVDELFPPTLYTKENVPEFPTLVEVKGAVGKTTTGGRGIIGADVHVEEGRRVSSRLDIPAYDQRGVWAVTLHEPGAGGTAFAYGQTSVLKNVDFITNSKGSLDIALGQSKGTIARIEGDWVSHNSRSIYNKAIDLLESDEWVQVGMNPFKHSYFYDKKTMLPVVSAEEVIQVGPLVLVKKKGMKTASPNDPMFKVALEELKNKKSKAPLNTMQREGQINLNETRFGFFGFGKKPKVEKDEEAPLSQSLDEVADNLSLNIEGKSLQEITRYVGSKGLEEGKEDYKIIAEKVANQLDALEGQGFSFSFNIARLKKGSTTSLEKPAPASVVEGSAAGMARMDNKKVYVDINDLKPRDSLGNGLNNETILHESIHAATMTAIKAGRFDSQKGTKLYKDVEELDKLYSHVAKQFNERSKSGTLNEFETKYFRRMNNTLANGDELVSWGLTNRDMQKYLESIKYKNTNAWTAFVQKIRDILGLSPKQDTVLSELLRVSDNLLSADAKQLSSVVDEVVRKQNNKGGKVLSSLQRKR